MKYDFISISKKEINGINNPLLHVEGICKKENYEIKVYADKKEKKAKIQKFTNTGDFIIDAELNKKDKKIIVKLISGKNEYEFLEIKNNKIVRVFNKIKKIISGPINTLKVIFITLLKGIKFLWIMIVHGAHTA